ncbi:MAG: hypothetical protein Kow0029_14880 [Candidatus Rifleibacteriota bacterium]
MDLPADFIRENFFKHDPVGFWRSVAEKKNLNGTRIHWIFRVLNEMKKDFGVNENVGFDAISGVLLFRQGFLDKAETKLKHVVSSTRSEKELRQSLALLIEIYQSQKRTEELERIKSKLDSIDPRFRLNYIELTPVQAWEVEEKGFFKMYLFLVWFCLLLFPAVLMEFERKNWLKRFEGCRDLRGPFLAFNKSNLSGFLVILSAILFILLKFPGCIGLKNRAGYLGLHIIVTWLLCQIPFFRLFKIVRPNVEVSLSQFVIDKLRGIFYLSAKLIAIGLSCAIVHFMVTSLPLWVINRPYSAVITLPALFTFFLVAIQFFMPILLLAKRNNAVESGLRSRIYSCGSGIHKSWLEFGAFSFLNTILLIGNLQNTLDEDELQLLLRRCKIKLESGFGFEDYLLVLNLILIGSIYFAFDTLRMQRFFSIGPTFAEVAAFLLFGILAAYIFAVRQRQTELETDEWFVREGSAEKLLIIYEKLNRANFLPERYREGDAGIFAPVSLDERKDFIRNNSGEYFNQLIKPESNILISLWRSRLAIEWKLGIEEAVFITSLDYQVNENEIEEELRSMAETHTKYGSECVFIKDALKLEILNCAQKACAFITEEALPHAKICRICSQAMLRSLRMSDYQWIGTEKGCCLKAKKSSVEKASDEA